MISLCWPVLVRWKLLMTLICFNCLQGNKRCFFFVCFFDRLNTLIPVLYVYFVLYSVCYFPKKRCGVLLNIFIFAFEFIYLSFLLLCMESVLPCYLNIFIRHICQFHVHSLTYGKPFNIKLCTFFFSWAAMCLDRVSV